MAQKVPTSETDQAKQGPREIPDTKPPEIATLLGKVDALLKEGSPKKALELINRSRIVSPWIQNAVSVCLLRMGDVQGAVNMLRGMVVSGTLLLRNDVPTVCKTNYATALLLTKNVSGCLAVLAEMRNEGHPAVQRLRAAIARWKGNLTFWQRIQWYTGGELDLAVELDFPPGDLE